jgi:hypothetical protein
MKLRIALALIALALPAGAFAQAPPASPPPPPTADQVKACVQQMDLAKQWTFDWKTIDIGQPRHPRNAYERAGLRGDDDYGYPVHVVYAFNRTMTVDSQYWMTHDAQNNWWIVAVCRPRR